MLYWKRLESSDWDHKLLFLQYLIRELINKVVIFSDSYPTRRDSPCRQIELWEERDFHNGSIRRNHITVQNSWISYDVYYRSVGFVNFAGFAQNMIFV